MGWKGSKNYQFSLFYHETESRVLIDQKLTFDISPFEILTFDIGHFEILTFVIGFELLKLTLGIFWNFDINIEIFNISIFEILRLDILKFWHLILDPLYKSLSYVRNNLQASNLSDDTCYVHYMNIMLLQT